MSRKTTRRPWALRRADAARAQAAKQVEAGLSQPLPAAIRDEILLSARVSLDAMRRGEAEPAHWLWVGDALNMGATLDRQVYAGDCAQAFEQAVAAHAAALLRAKTRDVPMLYTGPELQAVLHAIEVHEEQMRQVTWREMRAAMDEVEQRKKGTVR